MVGLLEAYRSNGGDGEVTVVVDPGGERIDVALADVEKARLEVEI